MKTTESTLTESTIHEITQTVSQNVSNFNLFTCDYECENNGDVIIEIELSLTSDIIYNDDNFDCYIYLLFESLFNNTLDFTVCDIYIININDGQYTEDNVCNDIYPCFTTIYIEERRRLQNYDGFLTADITTQSDTGISITELIENINGEFYNDFQVNFHIDIELKIISLSPTNITEEYEEYEEPDTTIEGGNGGGLIGDSDDCFTAMTCDTVRLLRSLCDSVTLMVIQMIQVLMLYCLIYKEVLLQTMNVAECLNYW